MLYDQWSTHNFEKILYFTENPSKIVRLQLLIGKRILRVVVRLGVVSTLWLDGGFDLVTAQSLLDNFQLFLDFLSLLHLLCIPLLQSLYLLLQLLDPPGRLTAAAALSPLSVRGSAAGSLRRWPGGLVMSNLSSKIYFLNKFLPLFSTYRLPSTL